MPCTAPAGGALAMCIVSLYPTIIACVTSFGILSKDVEVGAIALKILYPLDAALGLVTVVSGIMGSSLVLCCPSPRAINVNRFAYYVTLASVFPMALSAILVIVYTSSGVQVTQTGSGGLLEMATVVAGIATPFFDGLLAYLLYLNWQWASKQVAESPTENSPLYTKA